jgi:hypothetical protein
MFDEDIKIDREKLYKIYMDYVNDICDECDWVLSFTPKDIIRMVSNILETNPNLIKRG